MRWGRDKLLVCTYNARVTKAPYFVQGASCGGGFTQFGDHAKPSWRNLSLRSARNRIAVLGTRWRCSGRAKQPWCREFDPLRTNWRLEAETPGSTGQLVSTTADGIQVQKAELDFSLKAVTSSSSPGWFASQEGRRRPRHA